MKRKPNKPTLVVKDCTFNAAPTRDSEAVTALARAIESNAEAILALANKIDRSAPLIQVGNE